MARRWWEEPVAPAAPSLRRQLTDDEFYAEQQAVEDELFSRDRADDSQTQRALNQSMAQIEAAPKAVRGLARSLVGGDGSDDLRAAQQIIDREAQFAPDVQRLEDIQDGGDALAYGRNAVLSNLPTLLPTLAAAVGTGGASALAGAGLRGVAKKGLTRAVGNALTARAGTTAGAVAGSSAMQANQVIDAALDDSTGEDAQTRAAKATLGAIATGALDAVPQISLLSRLGLGGAVKRAIGPEIQRSLATRLVREGGKQALQEGGTEAIQTLGEKLTHRWVNDNVEVLGPRAWSDYLNAGVAGALVGGVLGAPAGIRGGTVRERAKETMGWFRKRADTGPVPVDPPTPTKVDAPAADTAAPSADLSETLHQSEAAVDQTQNTPPGFITALFGKHHGILAEADEDTLLDDLEDTFRTIDQAGKAPSDANGIIGRTQNDGFVRGGVPFNGFSLFNSEQAENIWKTAQGKVSVGEALVMTSLPPGSHEQVGDAAIKAAGRYLTTGNREMVDEEALTTYLKALEPDQRLQFIYAASHTAENIAKAREAGGVEELTPQSLRKTMDAQAEPLRSAVDVDDKADFDLANEFGEETGGFADFQQQQAMDEERPAPVALNEMVGKLPFVDTRDGPREGAISVTNSKGNKRDVSLASLVAQGWQAVKDGVFTAPNGVVDVVAQAIDVLQQRGLTVDPEQIKPGLWLGGDTRLTPRQAQTLRNGMTPSRAQPVQETPGLPTVPEGERPFDAAALEGQDQVQGEDGVENMVGEDTALRPRARSPLGTRVSDEGRLTEAETIDTAAADNTETDQRLAETDAIAALHRANEVLVPGTQLKGRTLDELIENFGKRVAALRKAGKPTKQQQAAIDGARRAIQRIERPKDDTPDDVPLPEKNDPTLQSRRRNIRDMAPRPEPMERVGEKGEKGLRAPVFQREQNLITPEARAEEDAQMATLLEHFNSDSFFEAGFGENGEVATLLQLPSVALSVELDTRVAELMQTPEGRQQLLAEARESFSPNALVGMMAAAWRADPTAREVLVGLAASIQLASRRLQRSERYAPGRSNAAVKRFNTEWGAYEAALRTPVSSVAEMAGVLLGDTALSPRQRAMLTMLSKSKVLANIDFAIEHDVMGATPAYYPGASAGVGIDIPDVVVVPPLRELDIGLRSFVRGLHPADVFIHEATHALTYNGERANPTVAKDIEALLQHVRSEAQRLGYPIDVMYGLLDTQEFLAEAFSNPEFQGILRRIPALGTSSFKNAWEQFKAILAKLLHLEAAWEGTALEEALTLGMVAGTWTKQAMDVQAMIQRAAEQSSGIAAPASLFVQPQGLTPQQQPLRDLFGLLNDRDRDILERALRDRGVREQIYNQASPEAKQQLDLYGPDLRVLVNLGAALHAQGKLKLDAGKGPLTKLVNLLRGALGLPDNQAVAQQILADHAANAIVRGRYDGEAKAFNKNDYTKAVLTAQRGITRVVQPVMDKLTTDVGTRMRETNNPALRKLATLFETRNAENAGGESFTALRARWMSQHATAYMEAVAGLKGEQKQTLARALQTYERPAGELGVHFDNIVKLLEDYRLWFNANIGGSVRGIPKRANYFPVVMDRKRVEDHWDELVALLAKPEYEADIRHFFDNDNKTPITELIDRMVQIAQTADTSHVGEVDFSTGMYSPAMSARRKQIMGFITSKVTDRKALAKFQTDSLDAIVLGYVNQMTKRAAKIKVFGEARQVRDTTGGTSTIPDRIGRLMAQAKQQGATPEQMALARDFVNMALGSYNAELNPTIRWVFRQVDKVWGSELAEMPIEQWAHYQQAAMTYQNVRLLGLAALSSIIDPLGSLVRGGSIRGTAKSMWDGLMAMRKDNDLRQMAEYLGVVEKYALSDAIAATYGGSFDPQGKLGKINNALFRFNGLEAITRHSRLTALAMGHRFLLQHAEAPGKHSERLLKELGLTAADIQRDPNHTNFVALTPKVEQALRRFVAESVVRPSPSQRPGWHNDPNFLFAAQYKGYLYAFYTTIVDRMVKEAEAGNHRQALIPLIPYLGVTVAAETVRHAIQHPGEEPPDEDEMLQRAMVRSGLVGPRFGVFNDARTDARYGSWITNSWIGPSGQQVTDLVDVATGDRGFGKTAIEALPGSAIFEDWPN